MSNDIEIDLLRQVLRYDPDTGKLYWLERPVEMFHDSATTTAAGTCKWWNGRFAGKEALSTPNPLSGILTGSLLGEHGTIAHRVAWALFYGEWPIHEVDHKDGNRGNNRITNLRDVTHQVNMQNKRVYKNSPSGHHGVSMKKNGRWQAYITINRERHYLGYYSTCEEALAARREAQDQSGMFYENHGRAA